MDTRVLIAIVLSLLAVFAYQEFVLKQLYPPPAQHAIGPSPTPGGAAPQPTAAVAPAFSPALATPTAPAAAAPVTQAPEQTVEVVTELYDAVFTSRGARLESFRLKKFRETAAPDSPGFQMVKPGPGGDLPLGLVLSLPSGPLSDREINYTTTAPRRIEVASGQNPSIVFSAQTAGGLSLVKTFSFTAVSYLFDMRAAVAGAQGGLSAAGVAMSQPLGAHAGYYDIPEIQALVNGKTLTEGEKALSKGVAPVSGPITYAGFGDRYFLSVFLPRAPAQGSLAMSFESAEATAALLFAARGSAFELATAVYMGPKELGVLEAVNPQLRKAIDFGWIGLLALAFLRALQLFHHITPNYGVDIILLTVAIRIAFLPMSIKSQRSMMRLQRLQPQVERLRQKLSDDKERLNREMMDLYKRNHVNPLGGCAPMLLQIPIFFGLYEALLNAIELRHAPFLGWITDLSAPDCLTIPHLPVLPLTHCGGIPVLVLLMGLSTFVQQWLSPQAADPTQQRMMMFTPIVFTVMLLNFPAGLSLYYFASNMLGIIQQFFLNREFKQASAIAA